MTCELRPGLSRPIDAFIKYFNEVKPYHTKVLEVLEQYNFNENLNVAIAEILKIENLISNDPLCIVTGFGVDWDDDCGFDSLSCCDLFDCIGGYGLIYNNSDMVINAPILSVDNDKDTIIVSGNTTYDKKIQIKSIISPTTFSLSGDHSGAMNTNKIFLIVPVHTYPVVSAKADGFTLSGNHLNELITRKTFSVYNSHNDGNYNVLTASYDFVTNLTTIKVKETLVHPNIGTGIIEIKSGTKNNGAYQLKNVIFNGSDTIVTVRDDVKTFTQLNQQSHGSVQLRTGLIYPRFATIESKEGDIVQEDSKIIQSLYDPFSNTSAVTFTRDLNDTVLGGFVRMYGYMFQAGFDPESECTVPNENNIHAMFSEQLIINIIPSGSIEPPIS